MYFGVRRLRPVCAQVASGLQFFIGTVVSSCGWIHNVHMYNMWREEHTWLGVGRAHGIQRETAEG